MLFILVLLFLINTKQSPDDLPIWLSLFLCSIFNLLLLLKSFSEPTDLISLYFKRKKTEQDYKIFNLEKGLTDLK